jgi:hypothetical protein
MTPTYLKTLATVLSALLAAATPSVPPPWQAVVASLATALASWVHLRRPGDVKLPAVD